MSINKEVKDVLLYYGYNVKSGTHSVEGLLEDLLIERDKHLKMLEAISNVAKGVYERSYKPPFNIEQQLLNV